MDGKIDRLVQTLIFNFSKKMAIKIALKGQFFPNEPSNTNHVFPSTPDAWAKELEAETGRVMQSLSISGADKDCYTIVTTPEGVIYAYRRLLPRRGDCAMVMLMADGPACDGRQLKENLKKFLEYGLKAESSSKIDDNIIAGELTKINNLFYQGRKPMVAGNTGDNATKKEAYRTFKTEEELHRILEYPYQSAYEKYKCVHIVSEDYNPTPTMGSIERIEDSVKEILFFKLPAGVSVKGDKQYVSENDSFVLQYSRIGCKTEEVFIPTPFTTNKHFNVSGDIIEVKSAEECKISFKRLISVTITDQHGNPISNWSYKIKGGNTAWRQQTENTASIELEATEDTLLLKAEGSENPEEVIIPKNASSFAIKLKSKGVCKKVYFEPVLEKKSKEEIFVPVTVSAPTSNVPLFQAFSDKFNNHGESPTLYVMRKSPLPLMVLIGIIALVIGMGLGCVGGHFVWPKDIPATDSIPDQPKNPVTAEQGENTPATPSISPEDEEKKKEESDEKYLSEKDI